MSEQKIVVVTGANRGLGFEICKELAEKNFRVILTSRDQKKGLRACEDLKKDGINVDYHQLEITDQKSVNDFARYVKEEYGRCDVLVNNAGIFPDAKGASGDWPSVFEASIEMIAQAMETNVYGTLRITRALLGLMKVNNFGRIVNFSSGMGQLTNMNGHCPGYRISKTGINSLTRMMAEELSDFNILVNSLCPGWVKTDMGGSGATRELPEGADTAIWLATLPDNGPRGKFFRDRKEFEW